MNEVLLSGQPVSDLLVSGLQEQAHRGRQMEPAYGVRSPVPPSH